MGEYDLGDRLAIDPCCFHVVRELARRRLKRGARPRIDKDEFAAGLHQRDIRRRGQLARRLGARRAEQCIDLAPGGPGKLEGDRHLELPVTDDGDRNAADLEGLRGCRGTGRACKGEDSGREAPRETRKSDAPRRTARGGILHSRRMFRHPNTSVVIPAYQPMLSSKVCLRNSAGSFVLETKPSTSLILPSAAS